MSNSPSELVVMPANELADLLVDECIKSRPVDPVPNMIIPTDKLSAYRNKISQYHSAVLLLALISKGEKWAPVLR